MWTIYDQEMADAIDKARREEAESEVHDTDLPWEGLASEKEED